MNKNDNVVSLADCKERKRKEIPGYDPEFDEKLARIKATFSRIAELMNESKQAEGK